jgi:predicted ribosome quality control (RQC) complex YloA/Tae2 family protein
MLTNYFILNRLALELNKLISGWTINEIFTQEKNILLISLRHSGETKYIEMDVNHSFPYLDIRDEFHRAKKNSINFFHEALNQKILSVEIAKFDRVIKLRMDNSSLYFAVRGKFTNIYFQRGEEISTFKKLEDDSYLKDFSKEMEKTEFNNEFNFPTIDGSSSFSELKDQFPFLGKEIIQELDLRLKNKNLNLTIVLKSVLNEISKSKLCVFIDEKSLEVNLAVETFSIYRYDKKINFDNLIEALNYFLNKKKYFDSLSSLRKQLGRQLQRELTKLDSKAENLKKRINRGSKDELYNQYGNLLLINIKKMSKGDGNVTLNNIYNDDKPVTIKLDPSFFPRQNVDKYFEKARDEKLSFQKSKQILSKTVEEVNHLKEKLDKLNSLDEIKRLANEYRTPEQGKTSGRQDLSEKFKHYIIENKYEVFVGKDSKNNDLLTLKFARPNDYWFHARSVPGSHVVLKVENSKEKMPKYILEKAASIAAFHSKNKNAGVSPVSYTQKKYVTKRKGLEPGQVNLLKEDVLLVKPEVPADAEFVKKEEKNI